VLEGAARVMDIPLEFVIFGLTLLGVALLHRHALAVALTGLIVAGLYRLIVAAGGVASGARELSGHFAGEWVIFVNLFLLLLGFAVLSNQFERSNLPEVMPALLPRGWTGGLVLLALVFVLSIFLDNIAGAIIGGVVARHVYQGHVGMGFLAAIVAAANAGGAGSVIGDTTTTMMWISGISPLTLAPAFVGAVAAFAIFGVAAAIQQHRLYPISGEASPDLRIDWMRAFVVLLLLVAVLATNLIGNSYFPELEHTAPALGLGLWTAILATALLRRPEWGVLGEAGKGAVFLVALVALASLMPVDRLPQPSTETIFGLGFLSSVFDNIPLTALALNQGGYDWALLAYAVGFGGSMVWFGSSAGVALTNLYPKGRSTIAWLRYGWHIPVAYIVGFAAMLTAHEFYG
jgi:Na+/H+ antiporter NhaD/arsenite permease-like protein